MELFASKGDFKGYVPEASLIDGYTMFFYSGNDLLFRFDVSGTAVANEPCGIDKNKVFHWLWEEGNELIVRNSFPSGVRILATSHDVRNGQVTTPIKNLIQED